MGAHGCGFLNELPSILVNHLCTRMLCARPDICRSTHAARPGRGRPRTGPGHYVHQWHADPPGTWSAIQLQPVFRYRPADQPVWFRGFGGHGQVPSAWRGHRAMIDTLPIWITIPVALLLIISGVLTLTGSLALLDRKSVR